MIFYTQKKNWNDRTATVIITNKSIMKWNKTNHNDQRNESLAMLKSKLHANTHFEIRIELQCTYFCLTCKHIYHFRRSRFQFLSFFRRPVCKIKKKKNYSWKHDFNAHMMIVLTSSFKNNVWHSKWRAKGGEKQQRWNAAVSYKTETILRKQRKYAFY